MVARIRKKSQLPLLYIAGAEEELAIFPSFAKSMNRLLIEGRFSPTNPNVYKALNAPAVISYNTRYRPSIYGVLNFIR